MHEVVWEMGVSWLAPAWRQKLQPPALSHSPMILQLEGHTHRSISLISCSGTLFLRGACSLLATARSYLKTAGTKRPLAHGWVRALGGQIALIVDLCFFSFGTVQGPAEASQGPAPWSSRRLVPL